MISPALRALALIAVALLVAAPAVQAQEPQPTVISQQYQPVTVVPDEPTAAPVVEPVAVPDVTENQVDDKSDTTVPAPLAQTGGAEAPADDVPAVPPPVPPAPEPAPEVHVEVGAGATNVAVSVRIGSSGRDGPVTQVTGGRRAVV